MMGGVEVTRFVNLSTEEMSHILGTAEQDFNELSGVFTLLPPRQPPVGSAVEPPRCAAEMARQCPTVASVQQMNSEQRYALLHRVKHKMSMHERRVHQQLRSS